MSDTPRTDAIIESQKHSTNSGNIHVLENFARTLERELAAAKQARGSCATRTRPAVSDAVAPDNAQGV